MIINFFVVIVKIKNCWAVNVYEKHKKLKLRIYKHKQFLISSTILMAIFCPFNVISQPLIKPNLNEVNKYSKKSFITKAVEKTGSSVVTINTQRYIKKSKLSIF